MSSIVMGFDYGTKRIGVAVGQKVTGTANAVGIIKARDGIPNWDQLDALVKEWQPSLFVVGLPLNMDDTMSDMGVRASRFARRLHGRYHLPAEMMDERLSTFEARSVQQESRDNPSAGDSDPLDAIAARLILESWLNSQ